MSDNTGFWEAMKLLELPEKKSIKSKRRIITLRFAKMRYESKGSDCFPITKRQFREWSQSDSSFIEAYGGYEESEGDKNLSPVIELKDKTREFGIDNLKWVFQKDKNRKNGKGIKIINSDGGEFIFQSARKAEIKFKLPKSVLSRALRDGKCKYKSFKINSI